MPSVGAGALYLPAEFRVQLLQWRWEYTVHPSLLRYQDAL